jgi:DNA-binding beta-propeller fold protein YncE
MPRNARNIRVCSDGVVPRIRRSITGHPGVGEEEIAVVRLARQVVKKLYAIRSKFTVTHPETLLARAFSCSAISPDGQTLYVPQLESANWHVVNAITGDVMGSIETKSGSHNTIYSANGKYVYLAGLRSPVLSVVDPATRSVTTKVGPFANFIRPFTVNGSNTLVFVNVNGLLGFEVGDLKTGKKLYHVEVQGYHQGPVKRHGCPSHGIALTPNEDQLWVADCANSAIHVFDSTVMPPNQVATIPQRDCVGWISFSMDGKYAYSSTGEIIDVVSRKVIAALKDEDGREVQSEKLLDVTIADGRMIRAGNQFGVGTKQ